MPRIVLSILLLSGCFAGASRSSRLAMSLNRYADDVRWARWSDAASLMVPSMRRPFLEAGRQRGPEFKVADLEMGGLRLNEDEDHAVVTMQVTWYTLRQTWMRSTLLEQEWRLLDGEWLLVRERQAGGETM